MRSVADVSFDESLTGERPVVRAVVGDRSRGFTDLARAVRWAELRADRVRVLVGGLSGWDPWPESEEERERLNQYVRRRIERFDREYREQRTEPVEWFYAVRDPDVEDLAGLAEALAAQPGVLSVVQRDRWWVIRLRARTAREVTTAGVDAFVWLAWPKERMDREFGRGRSSYSWVVSHGGDTVFGLAEYEDETLAEASTWR